MERSDNGIKSNGKKPPRLMPRVGYRNKEVNMKLGRVFILESPNPLDLLEDRGERLALEQVCKLLGYSATSFLLRDSNELSQTFKYISSIQGKCSDKTPLFLHLSAHGNKCEIAIGCDAILWKDLASKVQEMYSQLCYYHGPVVLVLSACGSNQQKLTSELTSKLKNAKEDFVPPEYVFVFNQNKIAWDDALVTWTIFYHQIEKVNFNDKISVQDILNNLYQSGYGHLKYFRWDSTSKKYKKFEPKKA
jgi:hypothetical protein